MFRSNALHHFTRQLVAAICLLLTLAISSSIGFTYTANAQATSGDGIWSDTPQNRPASQGERVIIPNHYRAVSLNVGALQQLLQATPLERSAAAQSAPVIFSLPLPDGTFGRFRIVESPIMEPELAAKFPDIKTYAGQGIDDPTATVRFDWTLHGFHALILADGDAVFIDPYRQGDTANYISYYKSDYQQPAGAVFKEMTLPSAPDAQASSVSAPQAVARSVGAQLRTYRLAMAADGEYTQLHGGTVASGLAAVVTVVNRVDGIYETDLAIRLVLVANNNLLIYTNPATDPYTDNSANLLDENQANTDAVIGSVNYDLGHVLSTSPFGGLAQRGVCNAPNKAKALSGLGAGAPDGDPFILDFVAHEIGHQFGANHIFNTSNSDCGPNRNASTAYEPGSGSTIMSYAGVCGSEDIQPHNSPFFNSASFDEIQDYTTTGDGATCDVISSVGNIPPVVNAGVGGFTIPKQTAFTLTGSATDANGDALTYSWEEHDLGPGSIAFGSAGLTPPFFRSFPPVTSPARTFPQWSDIVNGTSTIGEVLPNYTGALNFRLTARDNHMNGGGVTYESITFNVTTASGPFLVTAPNTAVTWTGATTQNVTWDVANTVAAPVSCANVKLLLSTDGGFTYPTTLAASVPNNGSASVTAPNISTTTARVQVACATSIFFDISNTNFTITQSNTPTPTATGTATALPTSTSTSTPTPTATGTVLPTSTATSTPTPTATGTNTALPTSTATSTATPTNTPTGAGVTIMLSSDENGSVPGLSYRDEDIIAYNTGTGLWTLVFDGSDVGLGNADIDGFGFLPNGQLLLSLEQDFTLSGFGAVDDADILRFMPGSYGPNTSGSYFIYFDGSDVGLNSSDEDVDAIDFDASGNLLISVNGAFNAQSVTGNDEDLFVLTGFTSGANTSGTWGFYFDGSDVSLTSSGEDIFGLWADHANSKLYLATTDSFSVPGVSGDEEDIFVCQYTTLGTTTACTFSLYWHGEDFGFDDAAIDGLAIGALPAVVSGVASSGSVAVDDTVEAAGDDANEPNPLDGEEIEDEATLNNRIFLPVVTK